MDGQDPQPSMVIRRRLERPYGSVRWKADSPDPKHDTIQYIGP